jgi:hypothetical protein
VSGLTTVIKNPIGDSLIEEESKSLDEHSSPG